jgi:hypothetical protein
MLPGRSRLRAHRDGSFVFHCGRAQQASGEDRIGGSTSRRAYRPATRRHRDADLAVAAAPDQRHRAQGKREARRARHPDDRRARASRLAWLIEHFGRNYGAWLHEAAHGRDCARRGHGKRAQVDQPRNDVRARSVRRRDRDQLSQIFTDLCVQLAGDLQRKGYAGKTIGVKLRYDNFETVTRDHTIEHATQDAKTIRRAAGACLKRVPLERRIRLLGVRIGALSPSWPTARPNRTRRRLRFSMTTSRRARSRRAATCRNSAIFGASASRGG